MFEQKDQDMQGKRVSSWLPEDNNWVLSLSP